MRNLKLRGKKLLFTLLFFIFWVAVMPRNHVSASELGRSLDTQLDEADMVIVGRIEKEAGPFKTGDQKPLLVIGTIVVRETIKGKAPKSVEIGYSSRTSSVQTSMDLYYSVGQDGIWFVERDNKKDWRYARYYPLSYQDQIQATLSRMKTREYGETKDGLALFAQPTKAVFGTNERPLISVGVKNSSKKTVTILLPEKFPLRLALKRDDGEPVKIEHFGAMRRQQPVVLAPEEVHRSLAGWATGESR
jgi:hypothetical protein